jgi:hypothetical protein
LLTLFDGSPNKVTTFLAAVSDRAASSSWNANLLSINNQVSANPQDLNLITQHCMLSLENVRAHAVAYINPPLRVAQDAALMYKFLRESLTESARTCVALQFDRYTVNGSPDGPAYLKVILLTFYSETNATNFYLRKLLHNLPKKIKE